MTLGNSGFQNNWGSVVEINHPVLFYWLMLINETLFGNDINSNEDPNIHIH